MARPDVDALLVPPGDAAALAAALRRVLDDDDLAEPLRAERPARAEEFSMAHLAERYVGSVRGRSSPSGPTREADGRTGARVPRWVRRIMASVMIWLIVLIVLVVIVVLARVVGLYNGLVSSGTGSRTPGRRSTCS